MSLSHESKVALPTQTGDKQNVLYQALSFLYWIAGLSAALPLIVYAYLGTFTRYAADDYCATTQLLSAENFWQASVIRYLEWSGGYSNLLFIKMGEWLGIFGMILMAPAALVLWLVGLTWLITEIASASGLRWNTGLSFTLASLAIFFSLYRTPNLHQILYWRSSLVGYLAALVLLTFMTAFLLRQSRVPLTRAARFWSGFVVFIGVFIIGGTSETIDALQIGVLLLALISLYAWKQNTRPAALLFVGNALLSAVLSMVVMAVAPGNLVRMDVSSMPVPNLFALGIETLTYVFQFIFNNLKVSPLPAFLAFLIPFLLFGVGRYFLGIFPSQSVKRIQWMAWLLPVLMLIVITFSFAPHAYARSFPSAYVRFPALFLFTLTLMAEGALLGILARNALANSPSLVRAGMTGLCLLTFLYPLRAAVSLYGWAPEYRAHALAWDARDAYIRESVAAGATDLVVVQLDTIGGVQEYKERASFWVNRCAAEYYGLHTLRAP